MCDRTTFKKRLEMREIKKNKLVNIELDLEFKEDLT